MLNISVGLLALLSALNDPQPIDSQINAMPLSLQSYRNIFRFVSRTQTKSIHTIERLKLSVEFQFKIKSFLTIRHLVENQLS